MLVSAQVYIKAVFINALSVFLVKRLKTCVNKRNRFTISRQFNLLDLLFLRKCSGDKVACGLSNR